ncbi:MAG: amino acid ABC transporter permease [Pseudomonadota bacterium]
MILGPADANSRSSSGTSGDGDFPYWLVAAALLGVWFAWGIYSDETLALIFSRVKEGVYITILVTVTSFFCASVIGLALAVGVLSKSLLLRQICRFYIEIVRGIPILVLLFFIAFAAVPLCVEAWNWATAGFQESGYLNELRTRDIPFLMRAMMAVTIGYSPFIAEVFRAGLQSVDRGQIEAATALGLRPWARFRTIIFPQAIRTILPPLGNDFIAMIKDSSLVSVLGVADVAQLAKLYAAGTFRYLETYTIVAYIYLILTLGLSLALRALERRLRTGQDK